MRKLWKKALAGVAVASMMLTPVAGAGIEVAFAEDILLIAANPNAVAGVTKYDFRDGSTLPEKSYSTEVTVGNMTIKPGTQNAFKYNGGQHGYQFGAGNSIEIAVSGPATIEVADCRYNQTTSLTMVSADGAWSQTEAIMKECWDQDGSSAVFKYEGGPNTLVINFDNIVYIPFIEVVEEIAEKNGAVADTMASYNLADYTIIPAANNGNDAPVAGPLTSADGMFTLNAAGTWGTIHGANLTKGDSFDVKVAGDAIITLVTCGDSEAGSTWTASSKKGAFDVETKSAVSANYDGEVAVFNYTGVATTLTFTLNTSDGKTACLHAVNVVNLPEAAETPVAIGNGKIDVWDFGLEELDTEKYNNMLTVDQVNGWYDESVAAGSTGVNINSFATEDIFFNVNQLGKHRYRTMNEAVSRYDAKSKDYTAEDGTVTTLNGFVYSNASATATIHMGIRLYEGDVLTAYLSSNGGAATYSIESPSGKITTAAVDGSKGAEKIVFNAGETGIYRLYCLDEKMVVCRLEREHKAPVAVTGKVTAPEGLADYQLVFTNNTTGAVSTTTPDAEGNYKVWLKDSYDYTVTLGNANGYVVESETVVTVAKDNTAAFDITIGKVELVTVTGKVTGLSEAALAAVKLEFMNEEVIYIPEYTLDGENFAGQFEAGITYSVVAKNVNDYNVTTEAVTFATDETVDITFEAKPVYDITVNTTGISEDELAAAKITFTNINEEGYTYTFAATDKIALRDGQYSVSVETAANGAVAQKLTKDVKVNGAAVTAEIPFESLSYWNFGVLNALKGGPGMVKLDDTTYYSGLVLNGSIGEDKTYLCVKEGGSVSVPVKAGQKVTVGYCYSASFKMSQGNVVQDTYKVVAGDMLKVIAKKFGCTIWELVELNNIQNPDLIFIDQVLTLPGEVKEVVAETNTGSTGTHEFASYIAEEDGYVVLTGISGSTYFENISVSTPVAYKEMVTVGVDKDYKTINEALNAVAVMDRKDGQRVTIMIDPGNYEEMLVVNVPDVTLANAAGDKASIELKNKGVDIAENAVRITSYYGTGYSYYSMGANAKWGADVLDVNVANGYIAGANPGDGTDGGSYWNATVVISANGFEAEGIIFENSFNQYISAKEAADTVVMEVGNKGERPTTVGDTSVQDRSFVERAAALAITDNAKEIYFDNCKFVGRQDTLYGGAGAVVAFNECSIYGAVDYIFGAMTAVFDKCDLVMNTSENKNDAAYLTAAYQKTGRGYLFYDCVVTSTTPGVDTASEYTSKPGYFGRPWLANTSEAVFVNTTIGAADEYWGGGSLINAEGWRNSLGGESAGMQEYNTMELAGVDNSASRAAWATVLKTPVLNDGTDISTKEKAFVAFLGEWNPFNLTITEEPKEEVKEETSLSNVVVDLSAGLTAGTDYDGISVLDDMAVKEGTVIDGVTYEYSVQGSNNPKPNKGEIPTEGAAVKVTPKADGTFKIVFKLGTGKSYHVVDSDLNIIETATNDGSESLYLTKEYEVKADKTYYIYGNGTKLPLYYLGLNYGATEEIKEEAKTGSVVDLSAGLSVGVDYNGISVLDDMAAKEGTTIGDVAYEFSVQGSNNPKPNKGEIPTEGAVVVVTPKIDGKFTVVFKLGNGKSYHMVDSDATVIDTYANESGESEYLTKTYEVKAGKTYYLYGNGTKLPLYFLSLE